MSDANSGQSASTVTQSGSIEPLSVTQAAEVCSGIIENVSTVIVGHETEIEHVVTALLARGHVLLDDVPGVGKTMLARAVAQSIDCSFGRIQFTPDLLPSDITGVNIFNQQTQEFEFQPGPIFANIVLGDEINRAPAKTQAALLEAMEEETATVDGETRQLPQPFMVIATQNAVEPDRTYELPFAEIDRFMKRLSLGYPSAKDESEMLSRVVGHHPIESLSSITDLEAILQARETVSQITVSEDIRWYATELVRFTRKKADLGVSPRGTIALLRAAQARAVLDEREYVIPDDIQYEAEAVLSHRILSHSGGDSEDGATVVNAALKQIPVE